MTAVTLEQIQLIPDERAKPRRQDMSLSKLPADEQLLGEAPDAAFIESVRRFGILQPVILVGDEVAAGRRRIKAGRIVELDAIPALIYSREWALPEVLALIENEQRQANPASDLRSIKSLLGKGAGEAEIRAATGLPKVTLDKRLRLVNLEDELLDAYERGQIKTSTAQACARLSADKQHELVIILAEQGKLKLCDVRGVLAATTAQAVQALPLELFETPATTAVNDAGDDEDWRCVLQRLLCQAQSIVPESERAVRESIETVERALMVSNLEVR